ncbi:MAG TPA: hypothetical protein VGI40_21730 [Pirellulaceae bacterium]|jgi:hypothetical protein
MHSGFNFRRALLYVAIGSVLLAALIGVVLVMRATWGWIEVRVILTTITIAVASVCGLASDLSRTPRGMNALPIAGVALTALGAGMILLGMWIDVNSDTYWKTAASACILAVATAHVSLLSIARLEGSYRWVFLIACQIIFGLAFLLVAIIFFKFELDRTYRFIAALAILDAAVTVIIPILHRIGKTTPQSHSSSLLDQRNIASIDAEILRLQKQLAHLEQLRAEISRRP